MQKQREAKARGGMALPALALVAVCGLTVVACGSGGSSKQKPSASAATGASGAAGATGVAKHATGASGGSGGSAAPAQAPSKSGSSGGSGTSTQTQRSGGTKSGTKTGSKKPTPKKQATGAPSYYTGQQKELYREAKIVCGALTLKGLAKEYIVKRTPNAVARAYSATYPVNLRGAVYKGCKAGVS